MSARETHVAVVGGGIGGLAAAHTLQQGGTPFLVLEASDRWGGVIRTEVAGGFLLEAGPDAFLAQKPEAMALCRELGLAERLTPSNTSMRTVYLLQKGRPQPLPEGMALGVPTRVRSFLRSGIVSWPGKLRMGLEPLVPRRRRSEDESVAAFFRRRFGGEALRILCDPLVSGIHGGDTESLSMQAVLPRFADLERRGRSLVFGLRPLAGSHGGGAAFYTLQGGLAELVNALVAQLPAGSRCLSEGVQAIRWEGGRPVITTSRGDTIRARAVLLALPPPAAARLLQPLDGPAAELLQGIRIAPAAIVHLAYRREDVAHALDGHGMLVPRQEGVRCVACSFTSTKFPGRAPGGHVLLRAAYGGMRDLEAVSLSAPDLVALAHDELKGPLGIAQPPILSRAYHWPQATPQMEVGHQERVARVERRLGDLPGLFLTGGGLRGVGLPDVIGDARKAAARAAEAVRAG